MFAEKVVVVGNIHARFYACLPDDDAKGASSSLTIYFIITIIHTLCVLLLIIPFSSKCYYSKWSVANVTMSVECDLT